MKSNKEHIQVTLATRMVKQVLTLIILVNIFMLCGTWVYNTRILHNAPNLVLRFVAQLNLGTEKVAAAWYSSMLLLLVAIAAACCYLSDTQRPQKSVFRVLNFGWLVFALIFITLSFDELGSFHEMIGETKLFKSMGDGSLAGGWYVFYLLVILAALFMIVFFMLKFPRHKTALIFAIIGVLLFLSNPIQEEYEISSWRNSPDPTHFSRPISLLLLEEGSEIFASFCLFFSFTSYLLASRHCAVSGKQRFVLLLPQKKTVLLYALGFIMAAGLLMLIVRLNAWNFEGTGGDSTQNWFPSVAAFIVFVGALYLYYLTRITTRKTPAEFLLIAAVSLMTSIFFGSNMYRDDSTIYRLFHIFLIVGCVVTGFVSLKKLTLTWSRMSIAGFVMLIIISFFTVGFYGTVLQYFAFSFLCIGIIINYKNPSVPMGAAAESPGFVD